MVTLGDDGTALGGLTCSQCGARVMALVNTKCVACAGPLTPPRKSWTCDRCGTSNAPHVDACSCRPEPIYWPAPLQVDSTRHECDHLPGACGKCCGDSIR